MSNSLIVIPINSQGVTDYEMNIAKRDNLIEYDFPQYEIDFLLNEGIIDIFNATFGIWIDEYEEEIIENKFLRKTEEIVEKYKEKIPVFYNALKLAIKNDTEMCLEL